MPCITWHEACAQIAASLWIIVFLVPPLSALHDCRQSQAS